MNVPICSPAKHYATASSSPGINHSAVFQTCCSLHCHRPCTVCCLLCCCSLSIAYNTQIPPYTTLSGEAFNSDQDTRRVESETVQSRGRLLLRYGGLTVSYGQMSEGLPGRHRSNARTRRTTTQQQVDGRKDAVARPTQLQREVAAQVRK